MISNRINLSKADIKELINKISTSKDIKVLDRAEETGKKPSLFFVEIGIDFTDAINVVKNLSYKDYQYTQLDFTTKFQRMHIFYKDINDKTEYIKIGFLNEKTIVISFHEKIYD